MSQVPTRWIDQGAHMAIRLAHPPNRHTAGLIEVELKKHIRDKTDWRRMLKNEHPDDIDLLTEKKRMLELLPTDLKKFAVRDNAITRITFPVLEYPQKVKSIGFDKQPEIKGKLMGIKGQYLIFDGGLVTNLRKHQGYVISISSR